MLHWPSVTSYSLCTQTRLDSAIDFYSLKDGLFFFSLCPTFKPDLKSLTQSFQRKKKKKESNFYMSYQSFWTKPGKTILKGNGKIRQ